MFTGCPKSCSLVLSAIKCENGKFSDSSSNHSVKGRHLSFSRNRGQSHIAPQMTENVGHAFYLIKKQHPYTVKAKPHMELIVGMWKPLQAIFASLENMCGYQ